MLRSGNDAVVLAPFGFAAVIRRIFRSTQMKAQIEIPKDVVADFCQRHQIRRLALLQKGLSSEEDLDLIVEFDSGVKVGLLDLARMERELSEALDRSTHLLTYKGVKRSFNPLFKEAIVDSAVIQYEHE
jgi:predicted nucleotidyltransferase